MLRGRWKATPKVSQIAVWCETTVETLWTTAGNCCFLSSIMLGVTYSNAASQQSVNRKSFKKGAYLWYPEGMLFFFFLFSRGNALIDLIFIFQLLSESTTERLAVSEAQPSSCRSMVWTQTPPGGHSSHPSERRRYPPSEHKDTPELWIGCSCWPSLLKN